MNLSIILFVLSLYFSPSLQRVENYTSDSLDTFLQDSAFKTLVRRHPQTGSLYRAFLPANLSGMEVSIVRLRSRRLWNVGASFSSFHIPSGTKTVPHVMRLAIVYQNLGNWSSQYYNVPGYSMATSVVGFKVFDASNATNDSAERISVDTNGRDMVIHFSDSAFHGSMISEVKCAAFREDGSFRLSEMKQGNVCYSQEQGQFSLVVPMKRSEGEGQRKRWIWYAWMVGFVVGLGGLGLVGYFSFVSMKVLKTQKMQVMQKQADEDLVLQTIWIGNSKMPSATITRTQPTIETGDFP